MKTLFAVLAIFICPTFAFGDTIGPSTGCANSAFVGDTYSFNLIYPGKQIAVACIFGVADFSDRTANLITGQGDELDSLAWSSKIPISRMRLRHVDGGLHEWSSGTVNEKSLRYGRSVESSKAAAHVWEPLLTTHKSSVWGDDEQSDLVARNTTDDFYPYAGSFARPASLDSRKDSRDSHDSNKKDEQFDLLARNTTDDLYRYVGSSATPASFDSRKDSRDNHEWNKKDDDGKSGSGKDGKKGDTGDDGKNGGADGYNGGGDDGGKGGGGDGGNVSDDGGKEGSDDGHIRKIPEPGSLILFGTGLLIGGALLRKFAA
jgi:hypothetical protein